MKGLYYILIAAGVLLFGLVALSTAATREDVIGTYELTCKETFNPKGYGKDQSIESAQLVLKADDTFILGDTEGTFSLSPKGNKILLQIEESSLDTFEDGCAEILSDLAFEKGTILEPWEIACVVQQVKISKIKIEKKTDRAKGKLKIKFKGIASFEVDGDLKQKKFAYKNICKINKDVGRASTLFSDDFSDPSTIADYTVVDTWTAGGVGAFFHESTEQQAQVDTGNDVGLAFSRALPPLDSGVFQMDFTPLVFHPSGGNIRIRLKASEDTYYLLNNTDGYGPSGLSKYVGGVMVDEASFSSEYSQGNNYTLTIRFSPTGTTAEAFGQVLVMNTDTTPLTVSSFEVRLTQQDAYIDNIIFSDQPFISITSPQDYHIQSARNLTVNTLTANLQPGWGVQFILEDNETNEITTSTDNSAPFTHTFTGLDLSEYTLDAIIVDGGLPLTETLGEFKSAMKESVGIGDYYVAFGDSLTFGVGDDRPADDISLDLRNTGGGFPPILNNLLTDSKGYPHTVINAGVGGEDSSEGLARVQSVIDAHPAASYFLILFGTNDSHGTMPVPSGLVDDFLNPGDPGYGELLEPGDPGYDGSFLHSMQQIIDIVVASGKTPFIAKVPIALGPCSICTPFPDPEAATRNRVIRNYNTVIAALISDNGLGAAPDFYDYFSANQNLFADNLHPDGVGYQSMADLWLDALTP